MALFDFPRKRDEPPLQARGAFASGQPMWEARRLRVGDVGEPYSSHAVVYRCVSLLARNLASVPLALYTGTDEDKEQLGAGPWYDLFLKPNPHLTRRTLWEATATYLYLGGECLWVLEGRGDEQIGESEVPTEIWPLPGSCATEILDDSRTTLLGWKITTGGGTVELPAHAVIHHKFFNPDNPWRGLSPLSAAMAGFRQDAKASAYNEAFYENGADPGGILTTDQSITPDQRQDLRRAWEDRHRGADKSYRVSVLGSGLDYKQMTTTHKDMQFLEQRRWNREELSMVFGVPKWFLGVSDDLNYATAKSAERILWTGALLPFARMLEDTLEAQLFQVRDESLWAEFDTSNVEALRDDLEHKLDGALKLRQLGYPLNEINERLTLGMEAQDSGDVGLLPMGLIPADQIEESDELDESFLSLFEASAPSEPERPEEPSEPLRSRAASPRWDAVVRAAMDPAERTFLKRINGYLQGRRAEVLRALGDMGRSRAPTTTGIETYLTDAHDRWNEMLRKQLGPVYLRTLLSGADSLGNEIGGLEHFDQESPEVLRFLAEKEIRVQKINDTIINNIRHQLLRGMDEGETLTELQDRIRHTFNTTRSQARTIARTESAQTVNGARQLAMEAEGIEQQEWITSNDAHVRPEHQALDGDIKPTGESFVRGITLRYPGDLQAPARQVINCRCTVGPVLD